MPASIIINQSGQPAGTAGKSRNDLITGAVVTCTNVTAESSYLWTLVDVPIRSALLRGTTSTSSAFAFTPDVKGTYRISLQVNGSSIASDNQVLIGAVLSFGSKSLGWRYFAAGEQKQEDNISRSGLGFVGDINPRGWATDADLQLEDMETATWDVQNAATVSPGVGFDSLTRIDPTTGYLDPSLLPPSSTGSNQNVRSALGAWTVPMTVLAGDVVYATGTNSADLASNAGLATAGVVGIVLDKPTSTTATIAYAGEISVLSGLTAGTFYYLGTSGGLIATPLDPTDPANADKVHLPLGKAKSSSTLLLQINDLVIL